MRKQFLSSRSTDAPENNINLCSRFSCLSPRTRTTSSKKKIFPKFTCDLLRRRWSRCSRKVLLVIRTRISTKEEKNTHTRARTRIEQQRQFSLDDATIDWWLHWIESRRKREREGKGFRNPQDLEEFDRVPRLVLHSIDLVIQGQQSSTTTT